MREPLWLSLSEVEKIELFWRRTAAPRESAIKRFWNQLWHEQKIFTPMGTAIASSFQLAASYAEGIAKNHAFIDGNKRTAFVAAAKFLKANGYELSPNKSFPDKMVALAEGSLPREGFGIFLQENSRRLNSRP